MISKRQYPFDWDKIERTVSFVDAIFYFLYHQILYCLFKIKLTRVPLDTS